MKKMFRRIIVLLLIAVLMVGCVACGDSSSSSGGSSSFHVPVSPYVTMVKDATHSQYGIKYGKAFDSFFSSPEWSYFKASSGEHVVEFEGIFSYSGAPATAKIQFVLDLTEGSFTAYHLSIDGEAQSKLVLAALIQKVFESY